MSAIESNPVAGTQSIRATPWDGFAYALLGEVTKGNATMVSRTTFAVVQNIHTIEQDMLLIT
jgi:hypothetical protein